MEVQPGGAGAGERAAREGEELQGGEAQGEQQGAAARGWGGAQVGEGRRWARVWGGEKGAPPLAGH